MESPAVLQPSTTVQTTRLSPPHHLATDPVLLQLLESSETFLLELLGVAGSLQTVRAQLGRQPDSRDAEQTLEEGNDARGQGLHLVSQLGTEPAQLQTRTKTRLHVNIRPETGGLHFHEIFLR